MGKLIDADVFDSILRDAQAECKKNGGNFRFGVLNSVRANLANQPSVDAVPVVHARWTTERTWRHDGEWYCSACEYEPVVFMDSDFCPNCGAKMDERRESE